jgi:hypothetical protein
VHQRVLLARRAVLEAVISHPLADKPQDNLLQVSMETPHMDIPSRFVIHESSQTDDAELTLFVSQAINTYLPAGAPEPKVDYNHSGGM